MQTDELIESLSKDLKPVNAQTLPRGLLMAILLGAVGTLVIFMIGYRPRSDLASVWSSWPMVMKLTYALSLALCAWVACERLARPGVALGYLPWLPLAPVLMLALVSIDSMMQIPSDARRYIWLGHSASFCPFNIALLSLPIFAALCRRLRQAAPTQLRLTAAIAGFLSGAIATLFYSLYCTESSVTFVATWYTLGMLIPAAYGAIMGPRLLHWR